MKSSDYDILDLGYNVLNNLEIVGYLGQGAHGRIYKVKCLSTGKYFALKTLVKDEVSTRLKNEKLYTERNALVKITELNIPFNIYIREAFQSNSSVFFLTDMYKYGNLEQFLRRNGPVTESVAKQIISQILYGLGELHKNGIFHMDLKLSNILVNDFGVPTICGFGSSKIKPVSNSKNQHKFSSITSDKNVITRRLVSEEIIDLQSLSEMMKSLLLGLHPHYKDIELSHESEELILLMGQKKINANPIVNVNEAKMHSWFEDVNWEFIISSTTFTPLQELYYLIEGIAFKSEKPFSRYKKKKTIPTAPNERPTLFASHFFNYDCVERKTYLENFDYLSNEAKILF